MTAKKTVTGITWNHSRGITPLLAAAQRFQELHPDIEISWKKRTLQEFADYPIERLTEQYDLLIIDHPWVGCADATRCVLQLDEYLPAAYLEDQQANSVGGSHLSYQYGGHQWALAIDAATPVASYRADLLEKNREHCPSTWEELLAMAKKGKVAVPAIPIDLLMSFYSFCLAHGKEPFLTREEVIDRETGLSALDSMKTLYSLVDRKMFACNPIAVAELMSSTENYWYCPFAYGYSNYARDGYSKHLLSYSDVIRFSDGRLLRTTVGGTGLSVSAGSAVKEEALAFAQFVVSGSCQTTLYVQNGGQPGYLGAWINETANGLTHNYFRDTLPALQRGYIRPRYNGYLYFQDHAGLPLHRWLKEGGDPLEVLEAMNRLYAESLAD